MSKNRLWWVLLEIPNYFPVAVNSIIWIPYHFHPPSLISFPQNTIGVFDFHKYSSSLFSLHLPLSTLLGNPMFQPALDNTTAFQWWSNNNFNTILHYTFLRSYIFGDFERLAPNSFLGVISLHADTGSGPSSPTPH